MRHLILLLVCTFQIKLVFSQNLFNKGRLSTNYGVYKYKATGLGEYSIKEDIFSVEISTSVFDNTYIGLAYSQILIKENTINENYFQFGLFLLHHFKITNKLKYNTSFFFYKSNLMVIQNYPYHKFNTNGFYLSSKNSISISPIKSIPWIEFELGICFSYLTYKEPIKDLFSYPFLGTIFTLSNKKNE